MQSTKEILDERGTRYGVFMGQAQIAQSIHIVIEQGMKLNGKNRFDFAPDQLEAINMIVNKMARIINGDPHYSDSWRDIAGYATLVADRLDNDTAKQKLIEEEMNERNRTETETDRTDNEPDTTRGDSGQEADRPAERPSRPTGRTELRRLPVRLEVQDGYHNTPTTEAVPGVPTEPRQ